MAYQTQTDFSGLTLTERFDHVRDALAVKWAAYRVYRNTVNELQELNDRELNDLGISRAGIRAIAMEAAYGK